ncbi:hypothetical protein Pla108_12260 [Botrimarina colliarenosi]|uniref:NIPSNAP domain-containing protein n=1 Tax=Botrimarina colliarenosi TaxID=2528001 RepID=A0A5C6ALC2_9BACT|nr:NIPSNAP family protein [Botrimarina colliarenosi]TWU00278.1 hypothetical protein Pla108_12260 [Botrimarina colliarenosi]
MSRIPSNRKVRRQSGFLWLLCMVPLVLAPLAVRSEEPESSDEPSPRDGSAVTPSPVYELRIYHVAPGKLEALNNRFRDHTLRLFEKHGIKNVGYWTAEGDDKQPRLYYLIAYPDHPSREKMLVNGIAVDPEFRSAVEESEKDGELTTKIESVILNPTDYSPLK